MFSTLLHETTANGGFPVTGLITVLVAAAVFYPLQKKIREKASTARRERWAEEDRRAEQERQGRDHLDPAASGDGDPVPEDPAQGEAPGAPRRPDVDPTA